jgi:hypothetical protein
MKTGICWRASDLDKPALRLSVAMAREHFPESPMVVFGTSCDDMESRAMSRAQGWKGVWTEHMELSWLIRDHDLDMVVRISPYLLMFHVEQMKSLFESGNVDALTGRIMSRSACWPFMSDTYYAVRAETVASVLETLRSGQHAALYNFGTSPPELLLGELLRNRIGGRARALPYRDGRAFLARHRPGKTNMGPRFHVETCENIVFNPAWGGGMLDTMRTFRSTWKELKQAR